MTEIDPINGLSFGMALLGTASVMVTARKERWDRRKAVGVLSVFVGLAALAVARTFPSLSAGAAAALGVFVVSLGVFARYLRAGWAAHGSRARTSVPPGQTEGSGARAVRETDLADLRGRQRALRRKMTGVVIFASAVLLAMGILTGDLVMGGIVAAVAGAAIAGFAAFTLKPLPAVKEPQQGDTGSRAHLPSPARTSKGAMAFLRRTILIAPLALGLAVPATELGGQTVGVDSARVVARIEGRSPAEPFGAVTDVVTSQDHQRVFVLDAMNGEVTVFSSSGETLLQVGRRGEGPGELSGLVRSLFVLPSGAFGVVDLGFRRVTLWGSSGDYLEDWPLPFPEGTAIDWGVAEQQLVAEISPSPLAEARGGPANHTLVAVDPRNSAYRTIHTFEGISSLMALGRGGNTVARPFPETALWATDARGRILVGRSGRYEITDISGKTAFRVARQISARPLTEEMRDQVRGRFEQVAIRTGKAVPEIELPTHLPVIAGFLVAPSGEVLVRRREYSDTGSDLAGTHGLVWDVFDDSGSFRRSLRLPSGFLLQGMLNQSFVGRVEDHLGVPSVVILRLRSWEVGGS